MLITLTTDFGLEDGYVGAMKGVISRIAPGIPLVDITHSLPPQDLRSAAYVLWTTVPYFPQESVHLVVVDPGVGTARHPIAVQSPWGILVGPDNGVFSYLWEMSSPGLGVILSGSASGQNPDFPPKLDSVTKVSNTFHGRDIFAPAAAYLARGVPLEALGSPIRDVRSDPVRLPPPVLRLEDTRILGEVIYVDHFGNVITSIGRLVWEGRRLHLQSPFHDVSPISFLAEEVRVIVKGCSIGPIRHTYGDVEVGTSLALVGSAGMLEVGVNQGHAASQLDVQVGAPVEVVLVGGRIAHDPVHPDA
jgi:hypothetical protein